MKALSLLLASVAIASAHSVDLTWTWSQGDGVAATGFHVERSLVSGGPYAVIATVSDPAVMAYSDATVLSGLTYYYVVTAFNDGGDSAPTNEAAAIIPGSSVVLTSSVDGVYPQPILYGGYPVFGLASYLPMIVNGAYPVSEASGVYRAMTHILVVTQ